MEKEETTQSAQQRLIGRIKELYSFVEYLEFIKSKLENLSKILLSEDVGRCLKYLRFLKEFVRLYLKKEMVFGRDVLLFEINVLFNQCIDSFKSSFEACFTNESSFDSYSAYDIIEALEKQLGEFSFFKIDGEIHSTTQLVISIANSEVTDDTLDILARYLNVGDTLIEDEITTQLLEQIKKLHLESTGISAYSAIVGPSFMGKTQIAFTLSQFISVIYVNLLSTIEQPAGCSNQKIYSLFAGIAGIFDLTTCNDQANPDFLNSLRTATSISILKYPFQTLGLIYLLLRTRKLREEEFENNKYCENCKKGKNCEVCKEKIFPIKAWLIEVAKIKTAMVPAMTIDEFHAKTEGIKLNSKTSF